MMRDKGNMRDNIQLVNTGMLLDNIYIYIIYTCIYILYTNIHLPSKKGMDITVALPINSSSVACCIGNLLEVTSSSRRPHRSCHSKV